MRYRPQQRRTFLLLALLALAISQIVLHLAMPGGSWWSGKFTSLPAIGQPEQGKSSQPGAQTQDQSGHTSVFPSLHHRLVRFLAGGYLASLMWYYLFNYPAMAYHDAWPPGMLDAAALGVVVMVGVWLVRRWQGKPPPPPLPLPSFMSPPISEAVDLLVKQEAVLGVAQIQGADPEFNLSAFSQDVRQILRDFYAAWNREDLEALRVLVTEEVFNFLSMGQQLLRMRDELNRMEELTINRMMVVAAGHQEEREFLLLWMKGRVVDFTLHRKTHQIVAGSLSYPKEWEEYWCFERQPGQKSWLVSEIREY